MRLRAKSSLGLLLASLGLETQEIMFWLPRSGGWPCTHVPHFLCARMCVSPPAAEVSVVPGGW